MLKALKELQHATDSQNVNDVPNAFDVLTLIGRSLGPTWLYQLQNDLPQVQETVGRFTSWRRKRKDKVVRKCVQSGQKIAFFSNVPTSAPETQQPTYIPSLPLSSSPCRPPLPSRRRHLVRCCFSPDVSTLDGNGLIVTALGIVLKVVVNMKLVLQKLVRRVFRVTVALGRG